MSAPAPVQDRSATPSQERGARATFFMAVFSFVLSIVLAVPVAYQFFGWHLPGYTSPQVQAGRDYMTYLNSGTLDGVAEARTLAAKDSAAYQAADAILQAWSISDNIKKRPNYAPKSTVVFDKDKVKACDDKEAHCSTYEDFRTDPTTGLLTSFTSNGHPIEQRVISNTGEQCQSDYCYSVAGGYLGGTEPYAYVIISVTNNSNSTWTVDCKSAVYVDPLNTSSSPSDCSGVMQLGVGGRTKYWLSLPNFVAGGQLAVPVLEDGTDSKMWTWMNLS